MGDVVELANWRRRRSAGLEQAAPGADPPRAAVRRVRAGPSGPAQTGLDAEIGRLERAVQRIDRISGGVASRGGHLSPEVETELLALVGEVGLGLVGQAADRAERVARSLGGGAATSP